MTDTQSNELSMAKAVQEVLNDNLTIVQSVPKFLTAKNSFDNKLTAINDAAKLQSKKIKGNAEDKEKAATEVTEVALALIGPAQNYFTAKGDNTSYQAINYPISDFQKMRHAARVNILTGIRDILQANAAELEDYGITAAQLSDFATLIDAYSALVTAPRTAINKKSAATKALSGYFRELKAIIEQLDRFMKAKKKTSPDFYNAYKSARVVINNRGRGRKQPATAAEAKKAA